MVKDTPNTPEEKKDCKKIFNVCLNRVNMCLASLIIILLVAIGFLAYGYAIYINLKNENLSLAQEVTDLENSNQNLEYQIGLLSSDQGTLPDTDSKVLIKNLKPDIQWSADSVSFTAENVYLAPKVLGLESGTGDFSSGKSYFILELYAKDEGVGGDERELVTRDYIYRDADEGK